MAKTAIQMHYLTRDFGTQRAVDGLSLELPQGIIFGFLGPNGAGKTTTIRMLLGLLAPTQGEAQVLGYNILKDAKQVRANSGALLEHNGLYEQMSAYDNLEFYGRIYKIPDAARKARIQQLLEQIGLWERRKERTAQWSKGMQQKLALARALLHNPKMLFLDEPTAGLDVLAAADVRDQLEALVKAEGVTVFLTTHNMSEAERLCSHVAVIRKGRLLAVGNPDELRTHLGGKRVEIFGQKFSKTALQKVRKLRNVARAALHNSHLVIDLKNNGDTAELVRVLVENNVGVEEVRKAKVSLEEVFMELMEEQR